MSTIYERLLSEARDRSYAYPADRFTGRGIVICAGGRRYFTCAWVCVNMLRHFGCRLPIEAWHLGEREMTSQMKGLLAPLDVTCVDATKVRDQHPVRTLNGWELKAFALMHNRFQEVLMLDADNVPAKDPTFLFDTASYAETGAIFWPDFGRLGPDRLIWKLCGVEYRDEPEFESGQIVVDKSRCWKALNLAMHLNEHSDFYYRHVHGDKETFHMAWRMLGQPYSMPSKGIRALDGTMCQHDFEGNVLFQHRNLKKWALDRNDKVRGFRYETECFQFLEELKKKWEIADVAKLNTRERQVYDAMVKQAHFLYVRVGHDSRPIDLLPALEIGEGIASMERRWAVEEADGVVRLKLLGDEGATCILADAGDGVWRGRWLRHEKMPIVLAPIRRRVV